MGGDIVLKLDSVKLTIGEKIQLVACEEFKGKAHTIRMAIGMAATAARNSSLVPMSFRGGAVTSVICPSFRPVSLPSLPWARSFLFHWPVGLQRLPPGTSRESLRFHRSVRWRHDNQAQ